MSNINNEKMIKIPDKNDIKLVRELGIGFTNWTNGRVPQIYLYKKGEIVKHCNVIGFRNQKHINKVNGILESFKKQ